MINHKIDRSPAAVATARQSTQRKLGMRSSAASIGLPYKFAKAVEQKGWFTMSKKIYFG
jgi:hypothetical protein